MSYRYPYGNTEQMNLDWFLKQWEIFKADWDEAEAGIDGALDAEIARVEAAMTELYAARDAAAASAAAARQNSLDAVAAQVAANNSKTAAQAAETSARASQQASAASAQEAQASAQGAENSALTATQAANTATQQAAGANAAKGAAEAAQQAAEAAQAAAAQSAGQAGQAATAAGDYADDAADSATLAQEAAQDMSDSVAQITTNTNDISDLKSASINNVLLLKLSDSIAAYPSTTIGSEVEYNNSAVTITFKKIIPVHRNTNYEIRVEYGNSTASEHIRDAVIIDDNDIILEVVPINSIVTNEINITEFYSNTEGFLCLPVDINYETINIFSYYDSAFDPILTSLIDLPIGQLTGGVGKSKTRKEKNNRIVLLGGTGTTYNYYPMHGTNNVITGTDTQFLNNLTVADLKAIPDFYHDSSIYPLSLRVKMESSSNENRYSPLVYLVLATITDGIFTSGPIIYTKLNNGNFTMSSGIIPLRGYGYSPLSQYTHYGIFISQRARTTNLKQVAEFSIENAPVININKLIGGNALSTPIANTSYNINDFIVVNNTLYKVIAPIANGETITPGTNVIETTILTELTSINNT